MMNKPVVFMFSGQGSQYYHMGAELYREQPVFKRWLDKLDRIAAGLAGESIIKRLYDDKKTVSDIFERLRYTHPAIFMVEYALGRVMIERGMEPDAVLGSSLGEFTAASFAGVITPGDALEMIVKQAEIIENCLPHGEGGMLTILHPPSLYDQTPLLHNHTELAAVNFSSHFVVSGTKEALTEIERFLKKRDIVFQYLPVSYAFHSRWIEPAGPAYSSYLRQKQFQRPNRTFVSSMTGNTIAGVPPDYFWQIVRKPMAFPQALASLEKKQGHAYLDLGPSGTLANFVKNNINEPSLVTFMSPFGSDLKRLEQFTRSYSSMIKPFHPRKEEKKMRAYLFPGQGSQKKGMGEPLFAEFPELTRKADKILGYSIKELCLEDPGDQLMQTQYTQPAVYVVNALSYLKKIQTEPKPDYVLGHSVGEYNALFASGVVDFESGLKLVMKRGELMAQARGGGMAAVMGLTEDNVEEILEKNNLKNLYLANYNSSYQLVISGSREAVESAEPVFLENGATHYRILNVSGAFHTPYMADAKKKFKKYVKKFKFGETGIPIISNVTARPYKPDEIKDNIIEQITTPVKWMESIRYLLAKGIDIEEFHEISGIGLSVVKALAIRINNEAGPLDLSDEEREKEQKKKEVEKKKPEKKPEKKPVEKIAGGKISPQSLGGEAFKREYGLTYAYLTGGMYKGIASKEMVVKIGKAGMMGFLGTGGLELSDVEAAARYIAKELDKGQAFGMNLVYNPVEPEVEEKLVDLFLKQNITVIEAAAYMSITPALVKYRARGLTTNAGGKITIKNRIIAKVSRPEVAEQFLSPAPERVVKKLRETDKITPEEAAMLKEVPMADDICAEADSGGHTDQASAYALMPAMIKLRDEMMEKFSFATQVRVGAAGGIGAPGAAAAAFILGADFILTGSINQCSVEAATSDAVKDLLQQVNVQDTDYAPAGDMFELGAKVQVLKRGVFFPARANKLYDLYRQYNSIDEIDEKTRKQLQERYFRRGFAEIYEDCKSFYPPSEIEQAERNPKHKMAMIFRWYFGYSTRLALSGDPERKVDYQVHCGPSLGAFNQWVKGTEMENWRSRHVDEMAKKLMSETSELLNRRFQEFIS
jgi:trans-AT polyketide synthase/acyltransferase/oxidoreductase domain-containing protein